MNTNIQDKPDIEDVAAEECTRLETESPKHDAYIIIDAQLGGRTSQHKSLVLQIFSNNDPNSTDRLKHVQDFSHFNVVRRGFGVGEISDPYEPKINIEDPAATLVCSKNLIWLAVVQIVDILLNHIGIQTLPTCLLGELNVQIRVQVMQLAPVVQGTEIQTVIGSGLDNLRLWQAPILHVKSMETGLNY